VNNLAGNDSSFQVGVLFLRKDTQMIFKKTVIALKVSLRNHPGHWAFAYSAAQTAPRNDPMNILAVDRALSIYSTLADRSETKGARKRLSEHLMKKYIEGEKDEHRLTVEGLSYLHDLDREIDSRS
jgi:hypothetical protein